MFEMEGSRIVLKSCERSEGGEPEDVETGVWATPGVVCKVCGK